MALLGISSAGSTGAAITDGTTHASDSEYGKWKFDNENGIGYLYTDETDPSDTDAEFISPAIRGTWVNGRKIIVGFNIGTAGANETSGFSIDGSHDGKNWVTVGSELDADITPDVAGVQIYTCDLSDYTLPWYRLTMNDDTNNLTTIKYQFYCSGVDPSYYVGMDINNTSNSMIGGVGPDPSHGQTN